MHPSGHDDLSIRFWLLGPAAFPCPGPGRSKTCYGPFPNQIALELSQGAEAMDDRLPTREVGIAISVSSPGLMLPGIPSRMVGRIWKLTDPVRFAVLRPG